MSMKAEDIDKLPAGPDLDALVAETVMGLDLTICTEDDGHGWCAWCGQEMPHIRQLGRDPPYEEIRCRGKSYSTDIAAAWEVVEKLAERGDVRIRKFKKSGDWRAAAHDLSMDEIADAAPLAICRAALRAVAK